MRDLSATKLEAAQKQDSLNPLVKITLTHNSTTVTLREDRIKNLPRHHEEPYEVDCEVVLDNSDGYFTDLDLKGYDAVIGYGLLTKDGEEFSDTSPLKVIAQQLDSSEGKLICTLMMDGIPNMLAEDRASENYKPDADDTKTVKTLIREIAGDSGVTHLACFNHTQKYDVVFDSEDDLISTYKPKDSFWILVNDASGKRLTALRKLLDYTHCVPRWGDDGKIHILKPTISGSSYNYEYSLEDHVFFAKAYRKTLVIPNKIIVKSKPDDDPQYSGEATDPISYPLLPKEEYRQYRLVSNDEAADLADAILSKYQLSAEMGAANVPMNVGAEVFDYVKVTDEREDDNRVGNIGSLTRTYSPGKYRLSFSFGAWLTVRKILSDLEVGGVDFEQLSVGTLYAKHILLSDIADDDNYRKTKYTSITADGIVILDQVSGTLDDVDDGGTYQRVQKAALSAAGLVLLDQVVIDTYGLVLATDISAGHIKLSEAVGDLDDIGNGSTYEKVKATCINSGYIELNSSTRVKTGSGSEWYDESGVTIDADSGINIWGHNNALVTRKYTKTGAIQCYVGSDGSIKAGGGDVVLDSGGIELRGTTALKLTYGGSYGTHIYVDSGKDLIFALADATSEGKISKLNVLNGIILPKKSSAPTAADGLLVYDHSDGYMKYYSSHDSQWFRIQRTGGWG